MYYFLYLINLYKGYFKKSGIEHGKNVVYKYVKHGQKKRKTSKKKLINWCFRPATARFCTNRAKKFKRNMNPTKII